MTSSQLTQRAFRRALRDFVGLNFTSNKEGIKQASALLNVSQRTVQDWFSGKTSPSANKMKQYTEKLKKPFKSQPKIIPWISGLAQILQASIYSKEILKVLASIHRDADIMNESKLKREILSLIKDYVEVSAGGSIRLHIFVESFLHKITYNDIESIYPSSDYITLFVYKFTKITFLRAFFVLISTMVEEGLIQSLNDLIRLGVRHGIEKEVLTFGRKTVSYLSSVLA